MKLSSVLCFKTIHLLLSYVKILRGIMDTQNNNFCMDCVKITEICSMPVANNFRTRYVLVK